MGALMAGGQATRFGGFPKGLAIIREKRVKEERIADRALAAMRGATDEQIIVSNDARAAEWFPGMRVVRDAEPGLGPLAGLQTALRAADGGSVMVVAWDMPFVVTPLLRGMRALCDIGADAVIPEWGHGKVLEPLCACYSPAALPVVDELLRAGERRATALVEALANVVRIPQRVLVEHGDPDRLFTSVDSLEQLFSLGGELP